MDTEVVLVILRVKHLIVTEWHITHHNIKEVIREIGLFKACNTDVGILVKLFCNSARNTVKLYTIQTASLHRCRHTAKEVSHTHGRLQYISSTKAKLHQCTVNTHGNLRGSIKRIVYGSSCRSIFILRKKLL